MSKTGLAKLQKTIEYRFGWDDAIEAAAEKMEHYRDVVKRLDEDPTEWRAYNVAAALIRKLKKP